MNDPIHPASRSAQHLEQISTCWPILGDPLQFTLRYAPAIERYLRVILRDSHEAEEVLQEFLLRGLERGFVRQLPLRGRFRDYLKAAVRHAALDHLRRRRLPSQGDFDLSEIPAGGAAEGDVEWLAEWRQCVLDRAWEGLHNHQRRSPGNLFHTVLRLTSQHPEETSEALAARAGVQAGVPVSAPAFRKQLSRARRAFACLVVAEVRKTLQKPDPGRVAEELAELGLLTHVEEFLPGLDPEREAGWRELG